MKKIISSRFQIMQLYEMLHIQHGIVLIGQTMSCKTTLWKMLAETLTCLAEERAKTQKAQAQG